MLWFACTDDIEGLLSYESSDVNTMRTPTEELASGFCDS